MFSPLINYLFGIYNHKWLMVMKTKVKKNCSQNIAKIPKYTSQIKYINQKFNDV